MKIKALTLLTDKLREQKIFYTQTLGFTCIAETADTFSVRVGWSVLTFRQSEKRYLYHFCFLIPSNKLHEALVWTEQRVPVVEIENGEKTVNFDTWNADSFYFYDAAGNIAEFIVRYDLDNPTDAPFTITDVLCVNEIGLGTADVAGLNETLKQTLQTPFWKGDLERFATNGSQEGLFLLPNYNLKPIWFPTEIKIEAQPVTVTVEHNGVASTIEYVNGEVRRVEQGQLV